MYNCYYDVVPYAIEAKENSNNLINALTCITAADINTKCSTVSYPLIFYDYNDYTHYCKN